MITYQVTLFLNKVGFFEYFCSFKVGCFTAIKKASRFFLLRFFIVVDIRIFYWKTWSRCWKRCLAGSESLFGFSRSFQRVITFRFTYGISVQKQTASSLLHKGMNFSLREKLSDFLCFPNNSKIKLFFGENLQFL